MKRVFHFAAAFGLLLFSIMPTTAQPTAMLAKQRALITISAYTATGNQARTVLTKALDARKK